MSLHLRNSRGLEEKTNQWEPMWMTVSKVSAVCRQLIKHSYKGAHRARAVHRVQVFQRTHEVQTVVQMQLPREQLTMEHVTINVLVF